MCISYPASAAKLHDAQKLHKSQMNLGFYSYGKKVLRFYGVWDDTGSLYGDLIHVRMHYFLADDTIEVLPIHERNTGRDRLPKFLKKCFDYWI